MDGTIQLLVGILLCLGVLGLLALGAHYRGLRRARDDLTNWVRLFDNPA